MPPEAPHTGAEARADTGGARAPAEGLYLFAIARRSGLRGARRREPAGVVSIRHRELEAVVRVFPFRVPAVDDTLLREHQGVVESVMRRAAVLPMPCGVVFRDRRELLRWFDEQYLRLDDALNIIGGYWELRVHVGVRGTASLEPSLQQAAGLLYTELRREAHAAMPLVAREHRLMSAAFLVPGSTWVEFVERAEDLAAADARLTLDVTGPWPAYDFVRLAR